MPDQLQDEPHARLELSGLLDGGQILRADAEFRHTLHGEWRPTVIHLRMANGAKLAIEPRFDIDEEPYLVLTESERPDFPKPAAGSDYPLGPGNHLQY